MRPVVREAGRIGNLVSGDHPDLRAAFTFRPAANSALAFLRAGRATFDQARANAAVLVQHGLSGDDGSTEGGTPAAGGDVKPAA